MKAINTDLIIEGASLLGTYGALVSSVDNDPPEPKTYTVDIPGGDGAIDLTDALTGGVAYDTRRQEFGLMFVENAEQGYNKLVSAVHGKRLSYSLSDDPGYTYKGRFTVDDVEPKGRGDRRIITAKLSITADPYKSKGTQAYKLNATGGKLYRFESGRRKVHPVIECDQACFFTLLPDGDETTVPAGTYRLNDVLFEQGMNECWINTQKFYDVTWQLLGEGDTLQKTWAELGETRWDEVHLLSQDLETVQRSWDDIALNTWESMGETGSNPKHWYELNWTKNIAGDSTAYLTYEWEDL